MRFPEDLDMDRVLIEALAGIGEAVDGWLKGAPTSEEPLMNRLTEYFTRRRRQCDVGVRKPVTMTSKVAFLHRRGKQQTDAYGADLAITIEIPYCVFRKTALFQLKVSENFTAQLEGRQMKQALADYRTKDRSFVIIADKVRQRMRVKSVGEALLLLQTGKETAQIDCAEWLTVSEWLTKWISCEVGQASRLDDPQSVEKLLQGFLVETPDGWECPWGREEIEDYPRDQVPARVWLQMIFRRIESSKERK